MTHREGGQVVQRVVVQDGCCYLKSPPCKRLAAAVVMSLLTSCGFFPESIFKLSPESRIPRWFDLDPNTERRDVQVEMSYYISATGRSAKFVLKKRGTWLSQSMSCNQLGLEPIYLGSKADKPENQYPSYEIITCKGITEVIEHRAMEPIFFVTDDPGVLRRLGLPRDSGYKDRLGMHG
jgi:hypothetical protein